VVALGTDGGQPLLDRDRLAAGVHLLWSVRPELGFPVGGYHVWRRDHRRPEFGCLDADNGLVTLEARPPFQAQVVAATGTGRLPVVEVLVESGGREAVAARTTARRVGDAGWSAEVWVDGAVSVRLTGLDLPAPLPWERMAWTLTGPADGGGQATLGDLVLAWSGDGSRAVMVREGGAPFTAGLWTLDLALRLDVGAERAVWRRGGSTAPEAGACAFRLG
jgi:hypothetical protein